MSDTTQVYLPRDWSHRSRNARPRIMVANPAHPDHPNQRRMGQDDLQAASFALMSLLREGGQWDFDRDIRGKDEFGEMGMGLSTGGANQSQVDFTRPLSAKQVEMDLGSSVFGDAAAVNTPSPVPHPVVSFLFTGCIWLECSCLL
jgi:hypothetical protein